MAKAKKFIVGLDSEVTAISLVEMPAIEEDYILLAKEQPKQMFLEQDEKHICLGPVLIPNRPIYRYSEDIGEYYIEFNADVIEKLAFDFMKNRLTNSLTLDHAVNGENLSVVESWIKTTENDKSDDLGFHLPIGTWFASVKVNDIDVWERVKNQELNGFSVESFVSLEELNLSKIDKTNMEINENFWSTMKNVLLEALGKDVEVKEEIVDKVKEEKIEEIVDETIEDTIEDVKEEVVEEVVEDTIEDVKEEVVEEVKEEINVEEYISKINELETKVAELVGVNAELSAQNEKLSKQPSVNKINVEASKSDETPSFLDFASGRIKY